VCADVCHVHAEAFQEDCLIACIIRLTTRSLSHILDNVSTSNENTELWLSAAHKKNYNSPNHIKYTHYHNSCCNKWLQHADMQVNFQPGVHASCETAKMFSRVFASGSTPKTRRVALSLVAESNPTHSSREVVNVEEALLTTHWGCSPDVLEKNHIHLQKVM